ncbi:MAG: hypothetical protein M3083_00610 [Actinomycetota bacterium]|nr:hypothetical protein [Actinomycetota bacterium]
MADFEGERPKARRTPLYNDPHSYPEWPSAAVGFALLPTWVVSRLVDEGAWSPPTGWLDTPLSRVEDEVRVALRGETQHCHGDRGLLLVAHRLLAGVDLCDMPSRHDPSCKSLHVPPGWTGVVLRVPPVRLAFVGEVVAEGRLGDEIVDRSRDPYLTVWPAASFFVVDHLQASDVTPLVTGPSDADPVAIAAWWHRWPMILTSWLSTPAVPGADSHLFGAAALPPPPPAYTWPSRTRTAKAARSLRRWVQSQDIWDESDPRPFPTADPEALVAAATAWAVRAALCFADFPGDLSAVLTEADLVVDYDFVPVDLALRAAVDRVSYFAATEAVWAFGDPEHTSFTLTRFACGLADVISQNDDVPLRQVVSEWATEVYDLDAVDALVYDRLE